MSPSHMLYDIAMWKRGSLEPGLAVGRESHETNFTVDPAVISARTCPRSRSRSQHTRHSSERPNLSCTQRCDNLFNHGGQALILAFPGTIVFKCPLRWGYNGEFPAKALKAARVQEQVALESISIEKEVFRVLRERPHPNIMSPLAIVAEGIFLSRMESTLEDRIVGHRGLRYPECYAGEWLRLRWASQVISAAAWLEGLRYAHGDLTPRNILLDRYDDVKVGDFGETVRTGHESQWVHRMYVPWMFEMRDHQNEQYAIGWTIYYLYRDIPGDFAGPGTLDDICNHDFPSVDDLDVGPIVWRCWRLRYALIASLDSDMRALVSVSVPRSRCLARAIKDLLVRV